ncbi:hypothetical protein ES703_21159 [subsurface metagenome]
MLNCSYCKVILKKSQAKGSRTQSTGASPSPSSSFSPFFKSPGAGRLAFPPARITSAIFIPLLTVMPVPTSTGGNSQLEVMCNDKFVGGKKSCG